MKKLLAILLAACAALALLAACGKTEEPEATEPETAAAEKTTAETTVFTIPAYIMAELTTPATTAATAAHAPSADGEAGAPGIPAEWLDQFLPREKPVWTLRYDANGGGNAPPAQQGHPTTGVDERSGIRVTGCVFTLRSQIPIREGYTFLGWTPRLDLGESYYRQPGEEYATGLQDAVLYAVWEPLA